jgi:DNA-3-methyladenine glycosylase
MQALSPDFYDRPVLEVAPDLLGCTVEHEGCSGVIVETEAYHEREPACHAFAGLTPRTQTLFGAPGIAYVYRSYGVHALLNAVCEPAGIGAAVLIRALRPLQGVEEMRARRAASLADRRAAGRDGERRAADGRADARAGSAEAPVRLRETDLCSGPGKLTQALGVWLSENGGDLHSGPIKICPPIDGWKEKRVVVGARIGITKAVELPWRFCVAGDRHVSRPRPTGWR